MRVESIKNILVTMIEYNTVNITQTYTSDTGKSLSVRCLKGTNTLEAIDEESKAVWQSDSLDETAQFINEYISLQNLNV